MADAQTKCINELERHRSLITESSQRALSIRSEVTTLKETTGYLENQLNYANRRKAEAESQVRSLKETLV
jgi:chromosome segregation ATPase